MHAGDIKYTFPLSPPPPPPSTNTIALGTTLKKNEKELKIYCGHRSYTKTFLTLSPQENALFTLSPCKCCSVMLCTLISSSLCYALLEMTVYLHYLHCIYSLLHLCVQDLAYFNKQNSSIQYMLQYVCSCTCALSLCVHVHSYTTSLLCLTVCMGFMLYEHSSSHV